MFHTVLEADGHKQNSSRVSDAVQWRE